MGDPKHIWTCNDCRVYICNGDLSFVDYQPEPQASARAAQMAVGIASYRAKPLRASKGVLI